MPQSTKTRVGNGSGRTSQTGASRRWRCAHRRDARGERGAVEPVSAKRLGRSPARRPAFDAEHRDVATQVRAAARRPARRRSVILEDEDVLEGFEHAKPLAVDAVQPGHVHDAKAETSLNEKLGGRSASCSITGPYAKRTASVPSRTTRPRPATSGRRARSAAARADCEPNRNVSPRRSRPPSAEARVSSALPG